MITLNKNWSFTADRTDLEIGYAEENKVFTLKIQKSGTEYMNWNIVLDVSQNGEKNIWAVEKSEEAGNTILSIPIKKEYTMRAGKIAAQLRATHTDGRVKKSAQLVLYVDQSINAPDVVPSPLPSEFIEYENSILTARNDAKAAAGRAEESEQAAADAVEQCEKILEDVKTSGTWREFGTTPCTFSVSQFGEVKLKSDAASCTYRAYSDTVKDMDTQSRTYSGGITEDVSKGYYEYTLSSTATQWFNVFVRMIYKDLEIGKRYKIYVDTTDLKPGSNTATMLYGQFMLNESTNGSKGDQIMPPMRISSAGLHGYEFTASSADVMMEYYPGNVVAELVAGYQFRFRDIYINRDGAGTAHTPVYDRKGAFESEVVLINVPTPIHFESDPICTIWYSRAESNVFTINGISPDSGGNVILPNPPLSRMDGRTLVCFGDSITGMFRPPTDYPSIIAKLTGMQVYNVGMEGCRMSRHPDQYYDAFCMYRLADAVASGDYSLQEAAIGHTGSYAAERVSNLKDINWRDVDHVTIFYGTNDIQGGVPLDNANNPKDTTTYLGAARYALEKLWGAYPNLKILLLTPIFRYWDNEYIDSDEKTFSDGRHFYEFGDALIQLARGYKIPAVDMYRTLGINRFNRTHYFPPNDGTHPNETGRTLLGEKITCELLSSY
ncbi:SGNH/GDSL hydrolase family protein [Anaeromassilibacillus senegalensis]|uniref:SGNH/GDSL hydrolase family protein n=1 Tax=Anaeromassilibacillus senegalensis TaxID=1673717 RepID=UPI00068303F0|nr:SGNH/GDSL hydrolase family protein [Anaeromassilibacillus senegalensis]